MFIISLSYKKSLDEVEKHLLAHVEYLVEQYSLGNFIASGRKVPRTGGVILSSLRDRIKLDEIVAKDPFYMNSVADYEITEFVPSMTSDELAFLKEL